VLGLIADFVAELRQGGLPVSPDEAIDAAAAAAAVGLGDRAVLRAALASCLVKSAGHRQVFDGLFELYFTPAAAAAPLAEGAAGVEGGPGRAEEDRAGGRGVDGRAGLAPPISRSELDAILLAALAAGDERELRRAARLAVALLAGIEAGRPVGVSYYLQRTLRSIDTDGLLTTLLAAAAARLLADDGSAGGAVAFGGAGGGSAGGEADGIVELARGLGELGSRLLAEEYRRRLERLTDAIEAEVRRVLAAERGLDAVAASLRRPLVEDVDFMHASLDELAAMRRSLVPLTRALAARLARKRRHRRSGPLDFRATMRRSLSTGGVPVELRFRHRQVTKPELFVLADVSGSVASFARFTLMLLAAVAGQFAAVRSFLFIDGVDEVTGAFGRAGRSPEALERAVRHADVVASDGHSDYGRALAAFSERYGSDVGPRTTLLVLGDARNNYHASGAETLRALRRRARHVFWLNPEPRAYWGSGDSIMSEYAKACDAVFECRNLRQLEAFVDFLA
jgi:uncharacterized protein with von Willebrand factor type A (vWA) domain